MHFMNLVDEADLFPLLDEDAEAAYNEENKEPVVTEPEQMEPDEESEVTESQPDEEPVKKSNWALLMLLAIIGIGGIGFAGYSFMNKKKKD